MLATNAIKFYIHIYQIWIQTWPKCFAFEGKNNDVILLDILILLRYGEEFTFHLTELIDLPIACSQQV